MFSWFKKTKFKRGDSVRVKNRTKYRVGEQEIDFSGWQGRVFEVEKKSVKIELDSITLKSVSDEIIKEFEKKGEYFFTIIFPPKKLEPTEARDTYEEVEQAQDELEERAERLRKHKTTRHQKVMDKWTRHFLRSTYYREMDKVARNHTGIILESFKDYMYKVKKLHPQKWHERALKKVCVEIIPKKVAASIEVFQSYGKVLYQFFVFLESRDYLETGKLQEAIQLISDEILEKSQDESNWSMEKTIVMYVERGESPLKLLDKQMEKFNRISNRTKPKK